MLFYVLAGLLSVFLLIDWRITRSSRRRNEWAFWEDWNFYVYGPVFVLLCLTMAADLLWFETDWTPSSRYPVIYGMPVVAGFMAHRWYRYFGARLRGRPGAGGTGGERPPGR
ncbi:hypothetical protein [Streptomyces sp. 3214.6]|uniref:hypothetical protein n=1 Tax=Streptomyces sp. 3214.6 TaxID=1882757 RepID=UPI00090CD916|nr:hypothetical protein [Streptomyces sp. 3214.6]SHI56030.1 hypothetical protein SAMN05444521_7885 [Streptomyces sp. 3214.6]